MTTKDKADLRAEIEDALRSTAEMADRLANLAARLDRPDRRST